MGQYFLHLNTTLTFATQGCVISNGETLGMNFFSRVFRRLFQKDVLTRETLLFSVLALLIPNAIYILLSCFYCPSRTLFVLLVSSVCFVGLFVHRAVFFVLLLAVMSLDALVFVSSYFQMPVPMLLDSMRYATNLNVWNSLSYLAVITALLAAFTLTYTVVRKAGTNRSAVNLTVFVVLLFSYAGVDWWANSVPQKYVRAMRSFSESYVPIETSASRSSDLEAHFRDAEVRNVLFVMVEGLGAFSSKKLRDAVWQPLLQKDIAEKYTVETGRTVYFGSTTSGEARELCNLKADYRDFRSRDSADCLPTHAAQAGYKTASFHAFTGTFFERFDWYPKIGFQEMNFLESNAGIDLGKGETLGHCGITFRGLCDTDVAGAVEAFLLNDPAERKFAYWLTLNSHKPVAPGEVPARLGCNDGGIFGDRELCLMAEQWLHVSYLVRDIAMDKQLAQTDIVLVGDHHPPLFTRSARGLFEPGKVAWLHLKPIPSDSDATVTASTTQASLGSPH